jgi:hypothetical protein
VGNDGETLVADSSTSTGLRYQVAKPLNAIYNSGYDVWQRGTSFIGTAYNYTADRWLAYRGSFAAGATFSQVASTQTGFQYALKAQRDSANTATDVLHLRQALENTDSLRFAGQTITLSFYAKAGANFSAASSYLVSTIYQGQGTNEATNNMTGWTSVTAVSQNNVLTTSFQRFSFTTTVSSAKTQLGIAFTYTPVGTAGADDSYQITGVQVEVGSVATGFQRQTGSIQGELAACQRYLPMFNTGAWLNGYSYSTSSSYFSFLFNVTPRVAPTGITATAANTFSVYNGSATSGAATSISFDGANTNSAILRIGTTAGTPTLVLGQGALFNAASGSIQFTGCEL